MKQPITVVCGFSRCGTSLMMRMLHVGGMEVYADGHAAYETNEVNGLPKRSAFLNACHGKAVKILEPQHAKPPAGLPYRFIWMRRDPTQQARSQMKFVRTIVGIQVGSKEERMVEKSLKRDEPKVLASLRRYRNSELAIVTFEELLADPAATAETVARFLGLDLDLHKMASVVMKRSPECLPDLAMEIGNIAAEDLVGEK